MPKIRRVRVTATIPQNSGAITAIAPDASVSGILRGYTITAPSMTAASYSFALLGAQGENLYSISSLTPSAVTTNLKDAGSLYLAIPFTKEAAENLFTITGASESGSTGVLTSNQTNALNNETVTIGSVVYTFVNSLSGAANEIFIQPNTKATNTLTSNNTNVSNSDTVTINSRVYTFVTALTEAKATGTVTDGNATNVSDGDTLTIGSSVYRFKNTLAQVNDVKIGASADATAQSLIYAINGAGTSGVDYFTGTVANASVSAGTLSAHAFIVTALTVGTAGNSIVLTTTSAHLTLSGSGTLSGGVAAVANQIFIDSSADASLTNLAAAINGSAGVGSTFSTGTTTNVDVSSSAVASHALTFTALSNVPATDNALTLAKSAATLSVGAGTFSGGAYTGDTTLENLEAALNGEAGAGSLFGTGTVANPDVTSAEVSAHALTVTSTAVPDVAVTTSTSAAFTWGATHLTGGGEAAARAFTVDLYIEK